MRCAAFVIVVVGGSCGWIACDETIGPDCEADECPLVVDGGALPDGSTPGTPGDDGAIGTPIPFDAGTTPAPTCKGLFELCSGQECCAPYGCTNGTCR
jgi:hypothetical protein